MIFTFCFIFDPTSCVCLPNPPPPPQIIHPLIRLNWRNPEALNSKLGAKLIYGPSAPVDHPKELPDEKALPRRLDAVSGQARPAAQPREDEEGNDVQLQSGKSHLGHGVHDHFVRDEAEEETAREADHAEVGRKDGVGDQVDDPAREEGAN